MNFDIAPATAIMIGISPPEGKKKGRLPYSTRIDSQTRLPLLDGRLRRKQSQPSFKVSGMALDLQPHSLDLRLRRHQLRDQRRKTKTKGPSSSKSDPHQDYTGMRIKNQTRSENQHPYLGLG